MKNFRCLTNTLKNRLKRKGESTQQDLRDGAHSVDCQPPSSLCINPPGSVSPSDTVVAVQRMGASRRVVARGKRPENSSGCSCSCSSGSSNCSSSRSSSSSSSNCSTSGSGCGCCRQAGSTRRASRSKDRKFVNRGGKMSKVVTGATAASGVCQRPCSRNSGARAPWSQNVPQRVGKDAGDAVKVLVRIRPPNAYEEIHGGRRGSLDSSVRERCVQQTSEESLCIVTPPGRTQFSYDCVAGPSVSQQRLFSIAGQAVVDNCLSGYNSCIFAYGQTGSGKTYTMMGELLDGDAPMPAAAGLIPRVFQYLFNRISQIEATNSKVKYFCKCSLLEIYNETITDLLTRASALQIREDAKRGVYVKGLTVEDVGTVEDALDLLRRGSSHRRVGETGMNSNSSRSHCVLTCVIESQTTDRNGLTNILRSRLNLVDLAGSERQKSSGAAGNRLKEASGINRSLSTLGLVIMSLVELQQGKKAKHVPYRDSKLTFLLQDSLGGNSKTVMIANVSPAACNLHETISTLRFATGAKRVKNRAMVNEDITGDARLLRLEISRLNEELARYRAMVDSEEKAIVPVAWTPGRIARAVSPVQEPVDMESCIDPLVVDALRREDLAVKKASILEAQYMQAQVANKLKDVDVNRLNRLLKLRDNKIQRLEASLDSTRYENGVNPDEEVADLRAEVALLKEKAADNPEVAILSAENKQLKQELAGLREYVADRERAEDEVNRLRAKVLQLRKELDDARSCAVEEVRHCAEEAASKAACDASRHIEEATARAVALKKEHQQEPAVPVELVEELRKQLEEEAANVKEAMHCNRLLEDEMEQLEDAVERLREESAHLHDEKALLAKEAQACAEDARAEICDLKDELAEVKVEKQELEDLLTEAVHAKHEIEMQRNEVSSQLLDVSKLNEDLVKKTQQLEEQVKALLSQKCDSKVVTTDADVQTSGDCCSSGLEIAELRNELKEEQEKNSTLLREFDILACQLENDVQTEIADCKNQLDWLLGELEETQQELNRTQGTLADRDMDIDDMQQALTASAYSLDVYKSKCTMLEDDLRNQLVLTDELDKQNKKLAAELGELCQDAKVTVHRSKGMSAQDIVFHPWMKKAQLEEGVAQCQPKSVDVLGDDIHREVNSTCLGLGEKNEAVNEFSAAQMEVLFGEEMGRDGSNNESELEPFRV